MPSYDTCSYIHISFICHEISFNDDLWFTNSWVRENYFSSMKNRASHKRIALKPWSVKIVKRNSSINWIGLHTLFRYCITKFIGYLIWWISCKLDDYLLLSYYSRSKTLPLSISFSIIYPNRFCPSFSSHLIIANLLLIPHHTSHLFSTSFQLHFISKIRRCIISRLYDFQMQQRIRSDCLLFHDLIRIINNRKNERKKGNSSSCRAGYNEIREYQTAPIQGPMVSWGGAVVYNSLDMCLRTCASIFQFLKISIKNSMMKKKEYHRPQFWIMLFLDWRIKPNFWFHEFWG